MSGVPDGVGAQNSQLAAHLHHLAHFLDLHDLAEVGQQALVLGIDEAPGGISRGRLEHLKPFPSMVVCRSLYLSVFLCRADPKLAEESQGTVSSARIYSTLYMLSTLYVDKDRGVPGDGQHYMLSTLYVERRVPGDGQRDYMLTLYSQHYMLTLFLQKIARHYMLII